MQAIYGTPSQTTADYIIISKPIKYIGFLYCMGNHHLNITKSLKSFISTVKVNDKTILIEQQL